MRLKSKLYLKYYLFIALLLTWVAFMFSILWFIVHLILQQPEVHQQIQLREQNEELYSNSYYDNWYVGESG